MRVVLHCCDTVLGQQWDAINSRICEWDVPSIATFEEETGLSFDDAGITVTAVPRKPDPKKKGNPADREREAAMEAEAFMRSDAALDVRCALQTMKAVQTQAIHFVVTEDIKRRLITLVRRRMDAFFSVCSTAFFLSDANHEMDVGLHGLVVHHCTLEGFVFQLFYVKTLTSQTTDKIQEVAERDAHRRTRAPAIPGHPQCEDPSRFMHDL